MDSLSIGRLETLAGQCLGFWEKRDVILDRLGKELEPDAEQGVQVDLLDLAILGADLRVRLARDHQASARRDALRMLAEAERLFGPNAVLYHERHAHAEALGERDLAREAERRASAYPPRTAWQHYALGRSLLQAGRLEAAAGRLQEAVALEPSGLWPNFYHGVCCHRLGRFEDAALAFTACATLAPKVGACYHNRALAFVELLGDCRARVFGLRRGKLEFSSANSVDGADLDCDGAP